MLLQNVRNPGAIIGINGLSGNLGIAVAALVTGFTVKWLGWRAAFALPGLLIMAGGFLFKTLNGDFDYNQHGFIVSTVVAVIGAVIVLAIWNALHRR